MNAASRLGIENDHLHVRGQPAILSTGESSSYGTKIVRIESELDSYWNLREQSARSGTVCEFTQNFGDDEETYMEMLGRAFPKLDNGIYTLGDERSCTRQSEPRVSDVGSRDEEEEKGKEPRCKLHC